MVKHIILWTLKDEYTEAQKKEIRAGIKAVSYTHLDVYKRQGQGSC